MESLLLSARHFLWSTAKGYNYSENQPHLWNETSASKVLVMNQGLEVVDLAMRIVVQKSGNGSSVTTLLPRYESWITQSTNGRCSIH